MSIKADIDFQKDLFDAATRMRGSITPSDYKHYVLPLIFLRYVSLRFDKRRAQVEVMANDPKSIWYSEDQEVRESILNDPDQYKSENVFMVPEEARWSYLVEKANDSNIKGILDNAMKLIEQENPELEGILPRIFQGSNLPAENVAGLIEIFSRDVFSARHEDSVDVLGRTYEYFIGNFASSEGNRGGEFFTPSSIVKLLVAMMEPIEGTVFDPACGSGGMFIQSEAYSDMGNALSFYGQENVETTLRLGKMNVLLHGMNAEIRLGDSLLNDQYPDLKADYVIANPPFNVDTWGAEKISKDDPRLIGPVTNANANYMWMQHFLYHLRDGGTAGYVMANGAMTTSVTGEKEVRQKLVDDQYIDCIVQLPEKLFFTTGIPCCLFFLSKNRDGANGYRKRLNEILFIDARKMGSLVSRKQKALSQEEIEKIASAYHQYRNLDDDFIEETGFAKVANIEVVKEKNYKLTPGIYVGTVQEEEDNVPFEEKMEGLKNSLREQFAESNQLQEKILNDLEDLV
ncbi:class I SAM-dependent DNA methyltransferase [Bacillus velezensis]|uniref:type I restriction-modification system subunit M n=1 Tax=Bacillus amyloliquefaciens group TaxID=1938374 RepID=UPI0002DAEE20|nr:MULTISPECIES: class I SAM-dependent DNA methyltransferase [Bacillus amyloliquefaciens group]MDX7895490.1 class I SAM-dependent DNA methyltransferase [Bacillus velezensis]MDX8025677.1 class I SAM-dependent DNA methyltransferase [Bacillus velezensis]MDX8199719.1 class I SAM-dependent DNA methyltransferase [Bacillus velezensis]MDX8225489.1 class I SAM-dependent DNA methyltransferase [Bacillus velezensis]MEC1925690.1 class I SAM-dependent DNA methyltransferase [Bacillus velezensis]